MKACLWFSLSLVLSGCTVASPPPPAEPMTFRVMTWNIQHGRGLDGQVDLERIAEVIRREGAPRSRIDYVWYARGQGLRAMRAWVPVTDASDHRPVMVAFEWE